MPSSKPGSQEGNPTAAAGTSSEDSSSDDDDSSNSSNSSNSSSSSSSSESSSSSSPPPPINNRPSSAAGSNASDNKTPKKVPPPPPPPAPPAKKKVTSPTKSKVIKSGTVTNTRLVTIKPSNAKKVSPLKKVKPPTKPQIPAVPPTASLVIATKSAINKKPVKIASKTVAIATKKKKIKEVPKSSLIIRTRSSCSSNLSTTTDEEDNQGGQVVDKKKKVSVAKKKVQAVKNSSSAEEESTGAGEKVVKKRPVTRRQKLNANSKKTIPTTTVFNQSLILAATKPAPKPKPSGTLSSGNSSPSPSTTQFLSHQPQHPTTQPNKNKYLSTWDSDFSDDQDKGQLQAAQNLLRVPAKTSSKPLAQLPADYYDYYQPPTCPFPSCDSSGHLSGKYPTHNFLSCCPKYNGLSEEECEKNDEERSRRESERSRYRNILSTPGKKPPKQTLETKSWLTNIKELKSKQLGVVSQYDDLLWKDAMAIAADCTEKEQNEGGINNCMQNGGGYLRMATMAVAMGRFEMKCWCDSPYPEPLSRNRRLFVCEFCLKPVGSGTVLRRHCAKCVWRHPPGDEIYRKDRLSVWEVDGKKQKTYCQNLCLLAKCFLDHKTLYLDVDPFLFYVMTLADSQGCHIVGYFSKEKNSFLNYNVSCILTLPPYQRQGFGRLLIDFSYLLTRVEGKVGSPEKPLSDLGLISYRSYWKDACLRRLCACASREINIKDLSLELGVSTADLISTLQYLGMLKYWKGKHLVLKKQDVLEEYLDRVRRRGNEQRQIDSSCLRWRPYQPPPDEQSSEEKS